MSKEKYRFVHLSDIHFGQERGGTLVTHDNVRVQLIRDCRVFCERNGSADGVLVNGDTAYSGRREEYDRAGTWLDELVKTVGCELIDIRVIPGNHDVDKALINPFCDDAHEKLRNTEAAQVDAVLERYMAGDDAGNPLLPKVAAYREFAARYGCDFPTPQRPCWRKVYPLGPQYRLALLGMNSVQVCSGDKRDSEGRMVLGNMQYVFDEEDDVAQVVLVHHPLNWFKDRADASRYLGRAQVLMLGHEHAYQMKKQQTDLGLEQVVIDAGATNPPESGAGYLYRYNWVEFELVSDGSASRLRVTVYPRVWDHGRTRFGADLVRLNGKDSSSFDVACPNFRPRANCRVDPPPPDRVGSEPEGNAPGAGADMTTNESTDRDFERLQYFFWTFLDWPARLKALVEIDVLPVAQSQPVPQTFERLALVEARRRGRLADLWGIVMRSVPADKQVANPFAVSDNRG